MAALTQPTKHSHKLGIIVVAVLLSIATLVGAVFTSLDYFSPPDPANSSNQRSTTEEKGLDFIQEVLSLDTTKYNVSIKTCNASAPSFATAQQLELAPTLVDYDLNSSLQSLRITCTFIKGELTQCLMDVRNDTIATLRQYRNLTDIAKEFLSNYQAFSGQNCTNMIEMIANVNPASNQDSTLSGSLKLTTTHKDLSDTAFGDTYEFRWAYTHNGCDYPALIVSYRNGVFSGFKDERAIYSIGDITVNISKKQATDIALETIKNYSYEMPGDVWISNFGVNGTNTYLAPAIRNSTYLYPCWTTIIYLDKTYPGSVRALVVHVWADSGQAYGTNSVWVPGYGDLT